MDCYLSPNFTDLGELPVTTVSGDPYNYSNTPLVGLPLQNSFAAFSSYLKSSGDFDANTGIYAGSGFDKSSLSTGDGLGSQDECTDSFVLKNWQTFFYLFQPYITDDIFSLEVESLGDSKESSYAGKEISYNTVYYTDLFQKNFLAWMQYRNAHKTDPDGLSFSSYLKNQTELEERRQSVVFWQFTRIVSMLSQLEPRMVRAATRSIIWNKAGALATASMAGRTIPSIEKSTEDVRMPAPKSIARQHTVLMEIENDRKNLNISQENSRIDDAILSFANDNVNQQKAALISFWSSLSTVLASISN